LVFVALRCVTSGIEVCHKRSVAAAVSAGIRVGLDPLGVRYSPIICRFAEVVSEIPLRCGLDKPAFFDQPF
jgi:hypothetical protein